MDERKGDSQVFEYSCTFVYDLGYPKGLSIGFPLNVIALLPHLVELYDDRTKMCIDAANNIAEVSLTIVYLLVDSSVYAAFM